jgi:hypothetical protein
MKTTILIKQHPSVQLAHLYEHLFSIKANELLNERGLFKWLDFTLNGTTYEQGGIISIDFKTYNAAANECLPLLSELHIECDESSINKALMQIHAEESYDLKKGSLNSIITELKTLDASRWQSIDEMGIIDSKDLKRSSIPLHLMKTESAQPITTKIALESDQNLHENPLLLALFTITARMILMTAVYTVAKTTGSYSYQIYTQDSGKKVVAEVLTAATFRSQTPDMQDSITQVQDTVRMMNTNSAFERLVTELQQTSYFRNGVQAPDYEQILMDTGILVGSEAWKGITPSDVDRVLAGTSVAVRRAKKQMHSPLGM